MKRDRKDYSNPYTRGVGVNRESCTVHNNHVVGTYFWEVRFPVDAILHVKIELMVTTRGVESVG